MCNPMESQIERKVCYGCAQAYAEENSSYCDRCLTEARLAEMDFKYKSFAYDREGNIEPAHPEAADLFLCKCGATVAVADYNRDADKCLDCYMELVK